MGATAGLAGLLADIEERLFIETPKAVRRGTKGWPSPPWCCALVFDSSQGPYLPPEIALTTVAERDAWLRKSKKPDRKPIWNAVAFDGVGAGWYEDKKLLAACEDANAMLEEQDNALPASKLIVRLAKRLNALPTKSFGTVADELVVYALDRNEPATKLLASCITAKQRKTLEGLRLL